MDKLIAHKWDDKLRTDDVGLVEKIPFSQMLLAETILKGLDKCGFVTPSPIQLRAIPLGKSGLDLIVQAKSGTGKTLVFSVLILEAFKSDVAAPQSLILTPTREIAVQITEVLTSISSKVPNFKAQSFIGGLNVSDDRSKMQNCRCVVGTPGRVLQLIEMKVLNVEHIQMLVFDEADKLLETSFLADINKINDHLKARKQMIAASATVSDRMHMILKSYMKNPTFVTPKREIPILLGVTQFAYEVPSQNNNVKEMTAKVAEMNTIFTRVSFKQCIVFSNSQSRAESYFNLLRNNEWPVYYMTGAHDQKHRLETLHNLKEFKFRILVTTDLMARGIDSENINLIINVDVPYSAPSYLHRIGRAGRFGSHGIAITFVADQGEDKINFQKLLGSIGGSKMSVLKFPKTNWPESWEFNHSQIQNLKQQFGEITGIFEEDAEVTIKSKSDDTITDNLMLLELTKMMIDPKKPQMDSQNNINNIFHDYKANTEKQPSITVDLFKMDSSPTNSVRVTDLKSYSILPNVGSVCEEDPDDCDSRDTIFSSSSSSTQDASSSNSSEGADSEEEEEEEEDAIIDVIKENVYHRKHDVNHHPPTEKKSSFQEIWRNQFHQQFYAIQNYVEFSRGSVKFQKKT